MRETTDIPTDKTVIERFIAWAIEKGISQTEMATYAERSKSWASLLVQGKIHRLQFKTRNAILKILENHK